MINSIALLLGLFLAADAAQGPKNIIIMIADGQGYAQVETASLFMYGKAEGQPYWEWPHYGCSTFSSNNQQGYSVEEAWKNFNYFLKMPADSAAAGTAIAAGVKTRNGYIGVDPEGKPVRYLLEDAKDMGKSVGVLTTVRFSHATPASFTAHISSRKQETDISRQMLFDSKVDLIIGTGHPAFDNDGKRREKPDYSFIAEQDWNDAVKGKAGADCDGDGAPDPWTVLQTTETIEALAVKPDAKRVFGVIPVGATLQADRAGDAKAAAFSVPFTHGMPTLSTLMASALATLSKNPKGFFLMGEGGAVDWGGHDNNPGRMIEEQVDFDKAVMNVAAWVEKNSSWNDTLLVVTADHECGYVVGPGSDPDWKPIVNNGAGKMPGFEFKSRGHTNQLVPLFVKGAGSENFKRYIKGTDKRIGDFVDDTDIAKVVRESWR